MAAELSGKNKPSLQHISEGEMVLGGKGRGGNENNEMR